MAYQGYGHGLGRAAVEVLHRLVVGAFRPDLTLVLDLPVAEGLARAQGRGHAEDRYERMDIAFHERLRAGFHAIVARAPERCVLLDARGAEATVAARIRADRKRVVQGTSVSLRVGLGGRGDINKKQ